MQGQALQARQFLPGGSAVKHLQQTGFLQVPGTSCAHCVWLDEEEMALMAQSGASVVHNPLSNLRLGSGVAPLSDYAAAGVNVAMGCDGACSSDGQDLLEALKLGTILQAVRTPEYRQWPTARHTARVTLLLFLFLLLRDVTWVWVSHGCAAADTEVMVAAGC